MRFFLAAHSDYPSLIAVSVAAGVPYRPGDGVVVLAEEDDRVVGWVEGVVDGVYSGPGAPCAPPHGYVQAVVVDPGCRRRGVGKGLLEAFAHAAWFSGAKWVFAALDENQGVEARVAWLTSAGFEPVDDPDEKGPVMGRWT
ncbi:GNAT family N-acetyltransferase [Nocardiopsis dassonvillei]|uniref:GNAT family N-acetyltransferase n=1 Tax=Nocardiopsis dassonvillei TaxID=2014 RepID=UPI00340B64F2